MVLWPVTLVLLLAWLHVCAGQAQEIPVFDTHIHYSQPDWEVFPPAKILAMLDQAGIRRALVSSTPDDGTLKLYEAAPQRIVPFLRPYRSRNDMGSWHSDPAVQAYIEERLTRGIYKGIGEFHLGAAQVEAPVLKRCAELAVQQQIFLHAHVDAETMQKLLQQYPEVRFLWAHAGMSASAATVEQLLARSPRLWVELALRSDVAPGETLDPAWQAVFLHYPERFMVGTLAAGMQATRRWLAQLPQDVAEQLAYRNAERLFGPP
jgi:predicted TIM-barrel fold metal-dependent hydrolase